MLNTNENIFKNQTFTEELNSSKPSISGLQTNQLETKNEELAYPSTKLSRIKYSVGKDKFDNTPTQKEAADFGAFEADILASLSPAKGKNYFTGPVSFGPHDDPILHPGDAHYRLATHAMPRRFLATDQDGYRDVATFREISCEVSALRGFGYTTWSHTETAPRTRMVFELNREVTRSEGIALGKAFDRMIKAVYGEDAIKHDASVYQNEQPCFTPGPNARVFRFDGDPIDVDALLQRYPEPPNHLNEADYEGTNNQVGHQGYARLTESSLRKVLGLINCEEEPVWHVVSNALARVYGEEGRNIFRGFSRGDYWGKPYVNFDELEVNKKFDRSLRELASRPTGYGIRYLIKISGLAYDDVEFEAESCTSLSMSQPAGLGAPQAVTQSVPTTIPFTAIGRNNRPLQLTENLHAVLVHNSITVRYNQVSKRCEILIPGLTCVLDEADNTALTFVTDHAVKAGMTASRIPEMIEALASKNPYCPVRTYIESTPWDGISRFTQFTGQISCGNPVFSTVLWRKWLIQAVGAVYEPSGIANAGVLVLTGAQGVGKTRLFADLTCGVSRVFLEGQTLNPADKDSVMSAASHWIVELGELDSTFRKADVAQLKAFITRKQDTLRRPYARKDSVFPRRTVFAGTVNDYHFLHDPSGNRRFWPVDVLSIIRDETIDYQQLWAEVKSWYDAGERWYLDDAELKLLNQYSETFLVSDPDVETLLNQYQFIGCNKWSKQTMAQICAALGIEKPTRAQTMRLAEAIRKYNGNQRPTESNGVKYHYVPDRGVVFTGAGGGGAIEAPVAPVS
jgi:putative DNA primase/helicase